MPEPQSPEAQSPEAQSPDGRFALALVPDGLLGPIVDAALDRLRAAKPIDVPVALRPLLQFDRKARATAAVRRQVARALDADATLGRGTAETLAAQAAVAASARTHDPSNPLAAVVAAAARDDLEHHVAALWATAPEGAAVGLGAACALVHLDAALADLDAERQSAMREAETARVAAQRADAALEAERARTQKVSDDLREERSARRGRDESASAQLDAQRRRADAADALAAEERARADAAEARARESSARLTQARDEVKQLRAALAAEEASRAGVVPAAAVRRIATKAADLAREAAQAAGAAGAAEAAEAARPPATASPKPAAPGRRPRLKVPGGLVAEDPAALAAMLATPDVLVVVDGYNAAFAAWAESSSADKRERLGRGLVDLHRRFGCEILCVFDGDGSGAAPLRHDGIEVVFSSAGEEADTVVVRAVQELAPGRPALVVSSDRWVHDHAEAAGATVVPSPTLIAVLRNRTRA